MIGVIKVLTTNNPAELEQHGKKIQEVSGLPTVSRCIPDQPTGIFDAVTESRAVPKIVTLGKKLEAEGCSLVVVSCAADPGVAALRGTVKVPVIGAGSAAAFAALALGRPVGVLGIGESVPAVLERLLGSQLISYVRPEGVRNATDLYQSDGLAKGLAAVQRLLDAGAQGIVLGCTGYSAIGLPALLRDKFSVPVIDGIEAAGMFAALFHYR